MRGKTVVNFVTTFDVVVESGHVMGGNMASSMP